MTRLGDAKLSGKGRRDFASLIGAICQAVTKATMFVTAAGRGDGCEGMSQKETDMLDKPPTDAKEIARETVTRWRLSPFGGDDNVLIDRIAAQVAAEKETLENEIKRLNEELIAVRLELAQLRVKPIVDNEKRGENLDDIMNLRFTSGR